MVDTTEDGRWVVVDGRRRLATDPAIPPALKTELVAELTAARRAAGEAPDAHAAAAARRRVQLAELALGERGEPWWEPPTPESRRARLTAAILTLAAHRAPDGTTCPSDAARAVGGATWRDLMPLVRDLLTGLVEEGRIEVRQRGVPTGPGATGPIRIALAPEP